MKQINDYGVKLQNNFYAKAKIQEDLAKGIFDGTWRYDKYIETIEDAIGSMLITYSTEVCDVLNQWINDGATKVWDLDIFALKQELQKVFT